MSEKHDAVLIASVHEDAQRVRLEELITVRDRLRHMRTHHTLSVCVNAATIQYIGKSSLDDVPSLLELWHMYQRDAAEIRCATQRIRDLLSGIQCIDDVPEWFFGHAKESFSSFPEILQDTIIDTIDRLSTLHDSM